MMNEGAEKTGNIKDIVEFRLNVSKVEYSFTYRQILIVEKAKHDWEMVAEKDINWQAKVPLEEFDAIHPVSSTSPSRAPICHDGR